MAGQVLEAPEHPVLSGAAKYDLRELRLVWADDGSGALLEMALSTHADSVLLRFTGVEDLKLPGGEIPASVLLRIQDTSGCPSATHRILPVRVGGAPPSESSLSFWARSVERVTSPSAGAGLP